MEKQDDWTRFNYSCSLSACFLIDKGRKNGAKRREEKDFCSLQEKEEQANEKRWPWLRCCNEESTFEYKPMKNNTTYTENTVN